MDDGVSVYKSYIAQICLEECERSAAYSLINRNSYQYGLAGEVFTLCNKFEQATASFAKLFELDDNPSDTFTSFYMQASFLKNNLEVVKKIAKKIIYDREISTEINNCKSPFCGNSGYAYLFLLYITEQEKDFENQKKYLLQYNKLDNKFSFILIIFF